MTTLYFLAVIALLVGIHEWGHFAMARLFGVGVRSFTLGFGKQFVSWVDPKTGTSWGLAPFPLGGYVGLLGEKAEANDDNKINSPVTGNPFVAAPLYAKTLILLAGPTINLLFAALLYVVLAYTAPPQASPILARPPAGMPADLVGFKSGDVIDKINGVSVISWRNAQTALLEYSAGDTITVETTFGQVKKLMVPTLKPQQNIEDALGMRLLTSGLIVKGVMPNSAASRAGLQAGDVITKVDSQIVDHPQILLEALQTFKAGAPPMTLDVKRDEQSATAFVTPELDAAKTYKIGVQFAGLPRLNEQSVPMMQAIEDGFSTAYMASVLTIKALGSFLIKPLASDQLAGPIGIAQGAKDSTDRGWASTLAFIAGLSISVGVLNLLPIPLLDGGQIIYYLLRNCAQALRIPFKINIKNGLSYLWTSTGVIFVLGLTILAFYADLKRLI